MQYWSLKVLIHNFVFVLVQSLYVENIFVVFASTKSTRSINLIIGCYAFWLSCCFQSDVSWFRMHRSLANFLHLYLKKLSQNRLVLNMYINTELNLSIMHNKLNSGKIKGPYNLFTSIFIGWAWGAECCSDSVWWRILLRHRVSRECTCSHLIKIFSFFSPSLFNSAVTNWVYYRAVNQASW